MTMNACLRVVLNFAISSRIRKISENFSNNFLDGRFLVRNCTLNRIVHRNLRNHLLQDTILLLNDSIRSAQLTASP